MEMGARGKSGRTDAADRLPLPHDVAFMNIDGRKMHIEGKKPRQVLQDDCIARHDPKPGKSHPAASACQDFASFLGSQVYASMESRIARAIKIEISAFIGETGSLAPGHRKRPFHGARGE